MQKKKTENSYKLSPGSKSSENKVKEQANRLLLNHPEALYNARGLFHNENGKTIIEEKVLRGDLTGETEVPGNQYDLREKDLEGIVKYARGLIDEVINGYDQRVACEDALTRAVAEMDEGRYANKVNASTYNLMLSKLLK